MNPYDRFTVVQSALYDDCRPVENPTTIAVLGELPQRAVRNIDDA